MTVDGKLCPECNQDIGLWAIIKLSWPTKLKCPHCGTKLRYTPWQIPFVVLSVIVYLLVVALVISLIYLIIANHFALMSRPNIIWVGGVICLFNVALWVLFEIMIANRLRNYSKLEMKDDSKKSSGQVL